jgi:hypothetical protein
MNIFQYQVFIITMFKKFHMALFLSIVTDLVHSVMIWNDIMKSQIGIATVQLNQNLLLTEVLLLDISSS